MSDEPRVVTQDLPSFITALSFHDLKRLRKVVKQYHMAHYPALHFTDREADRIIEALGPRVLDAQLKQAIDEGIV